MQPTMRRAVVTTVGTVAVAAASGVAIRRIATTRTTGWPTVSSRNQKSRWHVVTVFLPPEQVRRDGNLPEPLAELGDAVEVDLRTAPGGRGTELAARLSNGGPSGLSAAAARLTGDDPHQAVRSALRQAKQMLETGEVLKAGAPPTTRTTIMNRPLRAMTRRAGGEGRS